MRLEGLVVRYPRGGFTLGPLDLEGPDDRPWLVTGASGSGKSTLLRVLGGALSPTAGKVVGPGAENRAAYLPQFPERALAGRNLAEDLGGEVRPGGEARSRLRKALTRAGLSGVPLSRRSRELSGGERRRVALALMMLNRCQFWALDEPEAALDLEGRARLIEVLVGSQDRGTTLWVASHHPHFYRDLEPWTVVLQAGQVVGAGEFESMKGVPEVREALALAARLPDRLWAEVEGLLEGGAKGPEMAGRRDRLRAEVLENPGLG